MKKEIENLRLKLSILQKDLSQINNKKNYYYKYEIKQQKSIKIVPQKKINVNQKKDINAFLTLGKETSIDNNDLYQKDKSELKNYKLKYLIKNKEYKTKNLLNKYFYKFYYFNYLNSNSRSDKKKNNICVINKRYNNIDNQNNMVTPISIKTLSDNSSVFNDGKGRNLSIITALNMTDEDNKRK